MTTEYERQELIIASIEGQTSAISDLNDAIRELAEWLRQPASSDLSDLLKVLIVRLDTSNYMQVRHGAMLVKIGAALGVELVEA